MMRVRRGLLLGAAIALLSVCYSAAQGSVSVVKVDVTRVGDSIIFELHTTGPAGFQLDRLTEPGAITAWSDQYVLDTGFSEAALDLDNIPLGTIVSDASMFSQPWRSGLRINLGPDGNGIGATIVNEARRTIIEVPAFGAQLTTAEPAKLPGDLLASDELKLTDSFSEVNPAVLQEAVVNASNSEHAKEVADSLSYAATKEAAEVPEAAGSPEVEELPEAVEMPAIIEQPDNAVEVKPVESTAGGSFYVPRGEQADVNYQFPPVTELAQASGGSGEGSDVPMDDLGALLGEMFTELGSQMGGEGAAQAPTGAFSTPGADLGGSFQEMAQVSMAGNGKSQLSDITIDLFEIINTPLDQAITLLVAPTDFNIIVDASVSANTVSLSFKDSQTDLKSALDLITKVYGLEYVVQANTIVVAAKDMMAGNLMAFESRLFVLSYADPTSVKNVLLNTQMLEEGQVEIYAGETEYASVNDSTELSQASEGGQAQAKLMESNLSSTPRNALMVKALPDQMMAIASVIQKLDRQPKLIELEVRVCEAGESALKNIGIELNNNASTPVATGTAWTEQGNENDIFEAFTAGSFHRSPLQFLASLNTQIQNGNVEVLAQPTLSTVEGKQAIYFAGEEIPYISRVSQAATGQTQIEVDFLNVGVTLNFKPRLDADGKITIDVNPIVSSLLEFRIIGDLVEAPRTSTRQAATTVRVENGEPFVLAGLITETERESITKIPILGDLPMLGKLFRNKEKTGERTEIIIVVTPVIHN